MFLRKFRLEDWISSLTNLKTHLNMGTIFPTRLQSETDLTFIKDEYNSHSPSLMIIFNGNQGVGFELPL